MKKTKEATIYKKKLNNTKIVNIKITIKYNLKEISC